MYTIWRLAFNIISTIIICSGLSFSHTTLAATEPTTNTYATAKRPLATPLAITDVSAIPAPPSLDVKSYILLDAHSGHIMAEYNSHLRTPPASLTKIMTLYLVAHTLHNKQIHLSDLVTVSEKAWRTGGSRMFIKVGSQVAIGDLIKGVAIASGNDATVALAEHLAGSESTFVSVMNQTARSLNMTNTNFSDSSGLPSTTNYSTAFDLATLARAWILNFPEYYPWFGEKWIFYNNIKQPNRNLLLWRDSAVDGMKTGHTDDAGYCLVASAKHNDTRLIAVIMGAKSEKARASYSMSLLNYGFRFFNTSKLFAANTPISTPKIRFGKENNLPLGLENDLYVTTPAGQEKNITTDITFNTPILAPITKKQVCGEIKVMLDKKVILSKPLVALKDIPRANWFMVIFDHIWLLFNKNS